MFRALIKRLMHHADREPMWINVTHDQLTSYRRWSNHFPAEYVVESLETWARENGGNYSRYRHMAGEPVDLKPPLRDGLGRIIEPNRWED